jgi:DNA-binding transcriptional LysR family regulator
MAVALVPRLAVPVQHEGLIVDSVDLGVRTISAVVREGRRRDPNIRQVIRELHAIVVDSSRETLEVAV